MKRSNKFKLCAMTAMSLLGSMSIAKVVAMDVQPKAIIVQGYYAGAPLVLENNSMRICADATVKNYAEFLDYYAYWSVSGGEGYWFFERGQITTTSSKNVYTSKGLGKITYMATPQKTGTCTVTADPKNA